MSCLSSLPNFPVSRVDAASALYPKGFAPVLGYPAGDRLECDVIGRLCCSDYTGVVLW